MLSAPRAQLFPREGRAECVARIHRYPMEVLTAIRIKLSYFSYPKPPLHPPCLYSFFFAECGNVKIRLQNQIVIILCHYSRKKDIFVDVTFYCLMSATSKVWCETGLWFYRVICCATMILFRNFDIETDITSSTKALHVWSSFWSFKSLAP